MNLAVSRNLESITNDVLPEEQSRDGRLRLLYVGLPIIGFGTLTRELREFCERRDDVEAVHVTMVNTFWHKCLNRASLLPWNCHQQVLRGGQQWRRTFRSWCRPGGPLSISRFDAVLVSPQPYAWGFADLKAQGHRIVLGVNIDATTANVVRDFGDSRLTTMGLHRADRWLFERSDLVTCMGNWSMDSARHDYGVPPERLMLMPPIAPAVRRAAAHDGRGPTRIVFVGHDWKRKGGAELLRWHQQHWKDRAELHFIGGDGTPQLAEAPRNVVFHGRVPRERVVGELLPAMDLFVMPTKRDMSPWAALEASALGLPVVTTRVGSTPDLVIDGVTGLLVERGDEPGYVAAIEILLSQPGLRRRMGEAGRAHARRNFDREVVYSRLIERLKRICWGGRRLAA